MLKHQHYKDRPVKLTFPDGSHGYIHTDRRCDVYYDLPPQVKIEARNEPQQKDEKNCLMDKETLIVKGILSECYLIDEIISADFAQTKS